MSKHMNPILCTFLVAGKILLLTVLLFVCFAVGSRVSGIGGSSQSANASGVQSPVESIAAESAESALEYLNAQRPDVIFMDHLMPGMDGFEAVSAIKNNPDTATIPIMMYTSQQGELYVGQARALGAVGVLPKQVEPVEVSKVLEFLRVIGDEADRREQRGNFCAPSRPERCGFRPGSRGQARPRDPDLH